MQKNSIILLIILCIICFIVTILMLFDIKKDIKSRLLQKSKSDIELTNPLFPQFVSKHDPTEAKPIRLSDEKPSLPEPLQSKSSVVEANIINIDDLDVQEIDKEMKESISDTSIRIPLFQNLLNTRWNDIDKMEGYRMVIQPLFARFYDTSNADFDEIKNNFKKQYLLLFGKDRMKKILQHVQKIRNKIQSNPSIQLKYPWENLENKQKSHVLAEYLKAIAQPEQFPFSVNGEMEYIYRYFIKRLDTLFHYNNYLKINKIVESALMFRCYCMVIKTYIDTPPAENQAMFNDGIFNTIKQYDDIITTLPNIRMAKFKIITLMRLVIDVAIVSGSTLQEPVYEDTLVKTPIFYNITKKDGELLWSDGTFRLATDEQIKSFQEKNEKMKKIVAIPIYRAKLD